MFRIQWLQAVYNDGRISEVTFGPNLNIILGPSQCGKTMILKCIDYLLGAKNPPFKVEQFNVSEVRMGIETESGSVTLSRGIGSSQGTIKSNSPLLRSGTYSISKSKEAFNYGQALMGLFGIPQKEKPVSIFRTVDAKTGLLSIRDLINCFIVREHTVISPNSVFIEESAQTTTVKSALLYLLTGKNYLTGKEKDDNWLRDTKAAYRYVHKRVVELEESNDWLTMPICDGEEDILAEKGEHIVKNLDQEFTNLKEKYKDSITKFTELKSKHAKLNEDISSQKDFLEKCHVLMGEYESDVKRIRFILEGNDAAQGLKSPDYCPFCGNKMEEEKTDDCLDAAKQDLNALLPKIGDLKAEISALEKEIDEKEKELASVTAEEASIEKFLNENYNPKVKSIQSKIRDYGAMIREAQEKSLIRKEYEAGKKETERLDKAMKEAVLKFIPDDHLQDFASAMTNKIVSILSFCNFPNSQDVKFYAKSMDVMIGENTKEEADGKGFMAYLNSVTAFALHEVLEETGVYHGGPFIVDSPILSLREKKKIINDKSIQQATELKKPLIEYFEKKSLSFQTIVIENEIPDMPFDANTKIIRFGDSESSDRTGFLNLESES